MLDYELSSFNNGPQLITAPLENTKAMTVLFLVRVGSRYEDQRLNGISHFLEHMVFKGTKQRPSTLDIARALDSVGANYNAFTGEEFTGFFIRAASEHFVLALDLLYDMLYNSKFDPAEIEKEKGVIVEEINMYRDIPQRHIHDLMHELLYPNQALGRKISGTRDTVNEFERDDFISWRDTHYAANNIISVVVGGQENIDWKASVEKIFAPQKLKGENKFEPASDAQSKPAKIIEERKTDQGHLILAFRSIPMVDPRRPILKVLNNILGETMSSRLFSEVREKRGLAYYVSSELDEFRDAGAFRASAGVDIRRADEAIKVILDQFNTVKTKKVEDEELHRAKENLKGKLYLELEESFHVAEFLAEQQFFWGRVKDPEEIIAEYEKITAEDIQKLASEIFTPSRLNLAMVGPFQEEEKYQKIIDSF